MPRLGVARAVLGGAFAHNGGRMILSVLALALGVALGFAVALINAAAIGEFAGGIAAMSGHADLEVRGPRAGFDEMVFARLAADPDIAVASPVVEVDARLPGRDDALPMVGIDAFRAGAVTPALLGSATDPLDVLRPDAVFLSPAAAAWLGVQPGGFITVQAGLRDVVLRVAGLVHAPVAQRYAVIDIAAAQDLFARARTCHAHRPAPAARRRPCSAARTMAARPSRRRRHRSPAGARRRRHALVARLSRESQRAGAGRAVHRRAAGLLHAGAGGGAPPRAIRAAARGGTRPRGSCLTLLLVEGALVGVAGAILGLLAGYGARGDGDARLRQRSRCRKLSRRRAGDLGRPARRPARSARSAS